MELALTSHAAYQKAVPQWGKHILCQEKDGLVVVYQAFRRSTANYAVEHKRFGGEDYRYTRMSWIKPNFLWMMYRSGWALKQGQEHVLAIWIKVEDFEEILSEAVHSSFQGGIYDSSEVWKEASKASNVVLQWDPDHDVYGGKEKRRAIQLGLRKKMLEKFGKEMIVHIEDIGDYVREQKVLLDAGKLDEIRIPSETVFQPSDEAIRKRLLISSYDSH